MRSFSIIVCCLAAVLAPVEGLAQTAPPTSAMGLPSAPGPQLGPDEQLYPFNDGQCSLIDQRSISQEKAKGYRSWKWFGACRFGVADGKGYIVTPVRTSAISFHHGLRVFDRLYINGWSFEAQDNYLPGQVRFVVLMPKKQDLDKLDKNSEFSLSTFTDATMRRAADTLGTGSFHCPYTGLGGKVPILDRRYEADARKLCEHNNAGQKGNPNAFYVERIHYEYDANGELALGDATHPNPVIPEIFLCAYASNHVDCQSAFDKALAPYRDRIERTIAHDTAAQAEALAAVDARYIPLVAAEAARYRAIASRIASQSPTYSAPRAPQLRAAMRTTRPTLKTRAATHARKVRP